MTDLLSFEEFTERDPDIKFSNFVLYFHPNWLGDQYRTTEHYKRFQTEQADLEKRLRDGISSISSSVLLPDAVKPFDKELYEAYKIMRSYGLSDKELFK